MAEVQRIKVESVSTDVAVGDNKPGDFAQVMFRVSMLDYHFDIPVYVNLGRHDDTDIIRAGRHELATLLDSAIDLIGGWKQDDLVVKKREAKLKEL